MEYPNPPPTIGVAPIMPRKPEQKNTVKIDPPKYVYQGSPYNAYKNQQKKTLKLYPLKYVYQVLTPPPQKKKNKKQNRPL